MNHSQIITSTQCDIASTSPERRAALEGIRDVVPGNSGATQKLRIIAALELGPLTTYEASRHLDVYEPPARVMSLRRDGYRILMTWSRVPTESGRLHRIGTYSLVKGAARDGVGEVRNAPQASGAAMPIIPTVSQERRLAAALNAKPVDSRDEPEAPFTVGDKTVIVSPTNLEGGIARLKSRVRSKGKYLVVKRNTGLIQVITGRSEATSDLSIAGVDSLLRWIDNQPDL